MILFSFIGLFTLWLGYYMYSRKKAGTDYFTSRFRYRQIWYPAEQAQRAGLLVSIWGIIFIFLGLYASINNYDYSFLCGVWIIGVYGIVALFAFINRRYVKAEKEKEANRQNTPE